MYPKVDKVADTVVSEIHSISKRLGKSIQLYELSGTYVRLVRTCTTNFLVHFKCSAFDRMHFLVLVVNGFSVRVRLNRLDRWRRQIAT